MDFKEIIDIIAYVLGALGLTGLGFSKLKQKRNGGTTHNITKEMLADIREIKKDILAIKINQAVCKEANKTKRKR
jgi:hypothetical protein